MDSDSKKSDAIIYESPDQGHTIKARPLTINGTISNATIVNSTVDNVNRALSEFHKWTEMNNLAKEHPSLAAAIEQVKIIYELVRKH